MSRRLDWLPPRNLGDNAVAEVPFVQGIPDVIRVLIVQLARGAWNAVARLLELACLTLDFKPMLAHEMANAGATGVLLDILCQAPRHHPAWKSISTAGAGLLAALVHCEGETEAAQPQALRMLLIILESDTTCGSARQAVATVLHCVLAQRTVHRDKLLVAGALPVVLRVLGRLDVLCDLVAVQELLWTLVYLTDEGDASLDSGSSGPPSGHGFSSDAGAERLEPLVAKRLVPLLFLYGMPWHSQHEHLAALATRALHVHVAGYDAGKDNLRAAGVLSLLVESVRRHSAPYVAAAAVDAAKTRCWRGSDSGGVITLPAESSAATSDQDARQQIATEINNVKAMVAGFGQVPMTRGSFTLATARPPPHMACGIHADGGIMPVGKAIDGPYTCSTAAGLGPWTPWQRLLAVLLITGIIPDVFAPRQRRQACNSGAAVAAKTATTATADATNNKKRNGVDDDDVDIAEEEEEEKEGEGEEGPLTLSLLDFEGVDSTAKPTGLSGTETNTSTFTGSHRAYRDKRSSSVFLHPPAYLAHQIGYRPEELAAIVDGARMVCYGLLLPLLVDGTAEEEAGGGAGALLQRRQLCPLRETLATLKTLMCDCEANQLVAADLGLAALLIQLVAHGDMGLAWQAAEAAVFLSGEGTGTALVAAGAAAELAYLIEESAELLHSLTLRKQILVQSGTLGHMDHHSQYQQSHLHHVGAAVGAAGGSGQHQHQHQHRNSQGGKAQPPPIAAGGAAATPPSLTDVHVRPTRTALAMHGGGARPKRLYLVGRVPLDFTTSSSCLYGSHDAMSYCDYCTPSAAVKVLLRLMAVRSSGSDTRPSGCSVGAGGSGSGSDGVSAIRTTPVARGNEVCHGFAAAGGMYGVLLLLQHEAAGVHHSKLAVSLLTLLDMLFIHASGTQDELRMSGGIGVLSTLLASSMRPGVMDVFQLRVATCRTLQLALQDNAANKLAAREQGLLPLLVSLVTILAEQRKSSSSEVVVDDGGPLTTAVLETLLAATRESPATQEALVSLGILYPLCDLLRDEKLDSEVRTVAVRTLTAVVVKYQAGLSGVLVLNAVPPTVAWLEHCCTAAAHAVGGTATSCTTPPSTTELAESAEALAALLAALLQGGNPHAKSAIISAGALGVLLQLLRSPALAAPVAAVGSADSGVTGVAAAALAILIDGDTDLQNELVSQGGLTVAADIVRDGSAASPQALALLSAMLRANTFVKNTARQAGVPGTLVAAVRRCGLGQSGNAAAAASALAELAASNHANQEAVAIHGGLEVAVDLLRDAFVALPLEVLTGGGSGAAGAVIPPAMALEESEEGSRMDKPRGIGGGTAVSAATTAASTAATAMPYTAGEAAEDAAQAASLSRLLRALLGLVCACVELNGGNKGYVRELGGVSLLGELLVAMTEALTTPYNHYQHLQYSRRSQHGGAGAQGEGQPQQATVGTWGGGAAEAARLRDAAAASRAALSPVVAAACNALVAVTKESSANLARLEEQPGLAVALFKLLVATDAATSRAAALAIEWLVVRSRCILDAPSREAFELHLVDVLALSLYVPYAPPPLTAPPSPLPSPSTSNDGRSASPGTSNYGSLRQEQHQQQRQQQLQRRSPWYAVIRTLMPPEELAAAAVRDAAAVLAAVAEAADAMEAQQRQQQSAKSAAMSARPSIITTSHGSLPPLETVPLDSIASDHTSGLMLSNLLSGSSGTFGAGSGGGGGGGAAIGPGSQAWWAELAGSAATAFQRVANGVLHDTSAAICGSSGGAATAATASGTGSLARLSATSGMYGSTAPTVRPPAQERRCQVAWMLFLLAVKSPANRARIRWLVRASLSPLAQQLANAESCRAQLEAATAAAAALESALTSSPRPGPGSGSGYGASGASGAYRSRHPSAVRSSATESMDRVSSAVLESASSVKGRLPISTTAIEELDGGAPGRQPPQPPQLQEQQEPQHQHQRTSVGQQWLRISPAVQPPSEQMLLASQCQEEQFVPQQLPQGPQEQLQSHEHHCQEQQHQRHTAIAQSSLLPPQPRSYSRPASSSSAQGPMHGSVMMMPTPGGNPRAVSTGAASALYGKAYGTPAASSSSMPATPREVAKFNAVVDSSPAATVLRADRLSRTASGGTAVVTPSGAGSAVAGGNSATSTPRASLTGAVAAVFVSPAPHLGGTTSVRGPSTFSLSPLRSGMLVDHSHGEAAAPTSGSGASSAGAAAAAANAAAAAAASAAATATPVAMHRALQPQVSGGGSSIMSDDEELAMIQQEVALLANTTSGLTRNASASKVGNGAVAMAAARAGQRHAAAGTGGNNSPAAAAASPSPASWGAGTPNSAAARR